MWDLSQCTMQCSCVAKVHAGNDLKNIIVSLDFPEGSGYLWGKKSSGDMGNLTWSMKMVYAQVHIPQ